MFRSLEHYKEANGGSIEILEMPRAAAADDVGEGIPKLEPKIPALSKIPALLANNYKTACEQIPNDGIRRLP